MNASRHEETLRRYQRTWGWTALAPSSAVVVIWTYSWFSKAGWVPNVQGLVGVCSQVSTQAWYADESDPCAYSNVFVAVVWLQSFFLLSPMLAWFLARRRMHRTGAPTSAPPDGYRVAPPQPRSWHVSGPFPWWTAAMLFMSVLLHVLPGLPWIVLVYVGVPLSWLCHALSGGGQAYETCVANVEALFRERGGFAQACLIVFWWRRCWREASHAGVIERVTEDDGAPGFVLRTLGDVHPVTIVGVDIASRKIRLYRAGVRAVWRAVEPVDDLVEMDPTHAAA